MVRVKAYGNARKLVGAGEREIGIPDGTRLDELLRQLVGDAGGIPPHLVSAILVNGRNCAFREGLATTIADGDTVELLPIVTGG
jgi:molybdopterin converting factor small subunit